MPDTAAPPGIPTRTSDGKIAARDNSAGNKPARGLLGSPPAEAKDTGRPGKAGKEDPSFRKTIGKFLNPTRVAAPGAEDAEDSDEAELPGEEDGDEPAEKAKPKAKKKAKAQAPETPTKKGADHSNKADEDEEAEAEEDDGEEDSEPEPKAKKKAAPAPADDADDEAEESADDEDEAPKRSPVTQEFAQRFGLPLDKADAARKTLIDDVAATIRGSVEGRPQNGAPQRQPQPEQGKAPGDEQNRQPPNRQGTPTPKADEIEAAAVAAYGEPIKPLIELVRGLETELATHRQAQAQRVKEEVDRKISGFFGSKVKAGFRERYGSQREGLTDRQFTARQQLVNIAVAFQTAKHRAGVFVSDEDALEAAFQFENQSEVRQKAKQEGKREVETRTQQRHRSLDPGGGTGGQRAAGTEKQFMGVLRGFVNRR